MNKDDYDAKRFLSSCTPKTAKAIDAVWKAGEQLVADAVPREALPAVLILAAWGRRVDVEIVDDYDALLERTSTALKDGNLHHPDLFFVSCICILAERGQEPTIGGFETINVPDIFEGYFSEHTPSEEEEE